MLNNQVLWAELIVVQEFQELVIYLQHLPTREWGAGELDTLLSKVKRNDCLMAAMIMLCVTGLCIETPI